MGELMNTTSAERLADIKRLLGESPQGLSVNEISEKLNRHRNSVSRDLHALSLSGQVIQHAFGTTRVYSLAKRPPISKILHYTSDMALILDGNHSITTANDPLLSFLGCGIGDLEGCNIHEQDHPLLKSICMYLNGDPQGDTVSSSTQAIITGQGISHVKIKKIPTVFDDGTAGSIFFIEDITGEVLSREELNTSEAMYRAIVESLNEMVIRVLPDGTGIFANGAYMSYFTLPSSNHPGNSFFSHVSPDDLEMLRSHLSSLSPENPDTGVSIRVKRGDGMPAWNAWTFHGVFDNDGLVLAYQGIGRDITLELDANEREIAHTGALHSLSSYSREFLHMEPGTDIYCCIGRHLADLVPGTTISVFSWNNSDLSFTLEAIQKSEAVGDDKQPQGHDGTLRSFTLDENDTEYQRIRESLLAGVLVNTGGFFSRVCSCSEKRKGEDLPDLSFQEVYGYSAGLAWNGTLHGAVEILIRDEPSPHARHVLDAYLCIASLALDDWVARQTLNISDERFRKIATTNPLPISLIDRSGHYIFLSPRFTDLFGYTLEDIPSGREWFMHAFPDLGDQTIAKETWKRDLSGSFSNEGQPRQFRVRCKDGTFKIVLFMPVCLSCGQQLVVYDDITPRLEATQTRNLLSDIIRSSHDGIISATIDGRVLSWNPSAERIYGYCAGEVEGKAVNMLEPPYLKGEIASILDRIRRGESLVQYETHRVRKDGRMIDVSLTISPVFQEDGSIMGASTIVRDITTQKAEERLRDAESKYQALVDNINVGVYRSTGDPKGRFIWGNTSLLHILGYNTLDELQEVTVSDIFAKSTGREELLADLKLHGFVKNMEITLRRGDGPIIHVLVTALATFNPDGSISHINGIVEDITGQRLLEKKVAQLYYHQPDLQLPPHVS